MSIAKLHKKVYDFGVRLSKVINGETINKKLKEIF